MKLDKKVLTEYIDLKRQSDTLDRRLSELKEQITAVVPRGTELQVGEYFVQHTEVTRENFKLKEAKEKLDLRMLNPFITSTTFGQVRVK